MNFARENISLILCTNKEEGIDFLCPWRCLKVCQIIKSVFGIIKHLMTGPKGNSEFCFPETFNIEAEGKQNLLFPAGPVIKCFVTPSDSKIEKNCEEIVCCLRRLAQIFRGFTEHDLITCESKVHVVVSLES